MLLEQALGFRFHDGGGEARQNRSYATKKRFVHHAGLSEVGGLGGAAGVGERGQQKILHDRAQQYVGAEALGMRIEFCKQLRLRKLLGCGLAVDDKFCCVSARSSRDRCASTLPGGKQQHRRFGDLHLLVIACGLKFLAAVMKAGSKLARAFYRGTIDWLCDVGKFRIRGIHQNDAPFGEDARIDTRESTAEGFTRAVRITQDLGCFGVAKQSYGLFDYGIDLVVKANRTDGSPRYVLACSREDL